MHIVAIHNISNSEKFWSTVQQTPIPDGVTLHTTLPNGPGTRAVCLWEAGSLAEVKGLVEGAVGQFSDNEYFEVDATKAMGL
jgi:hypothetical protein